MEELLPDIEPTRVDINSIDEIRLKDNTNLLDEIEKNGYRDDYIKFMRRSNFFSDDKVKFKPKEPPPVPPNKQPSPESNSKSVAAVITLIVMIVISVVVIRKQKRYRREDIALLEDDPNVPYSFFRGIRSSDVGLNVLIVSEIFIYFLIWLAAMHMFNKISANTHQAIS